MQTPIRRWWTRSPDAPRRRPRRGWSCETVRDQSSGPVTGPRNPHALHTPHRRGRRRHARGHRRRAHRGPVRRDPAGAAHRRARRHPPAWPRWTSPASCRRRAREDGQPLCFIGAGAYDHHIPAAVWQIATRGEFYSAYTPYQAEASQGTLQLLYEFQSMMTALTGLDGLQRLPLRRGLGPGEAVLMAVRANRKAPAPRVLVPRALHPAYRRAVQAIVRAPGDRAGGGPFDRRAVTYPSCRPGGSRREQADRGPGDSPAQLLRGAGGGGRPHRLGPGQRGALVIGVVNPVALALLKPPGDWGARAPTSPAARPSRWAYRSPPAGPTSDSCAASKTWCARCPGASPAAPWTWTASPASP
jgi:hypothetical protein